jgi:small subunit ribosomal protein S17
MAEEPEIDGGETPAPEAEQVDTTAASPVDDASVSGAATADETAPESAGEAPPKRRTRARKKPQAQKVLTPEERRTLAAENRRKKAIARRAQRGAARAKYKAAEHERQATPPREHVPGKQKTRQGVVVSDRAEQTITVRIDVARRHRRYEKIVRTSNTVHAHDARNEAHIGDTVIVRESRPLSRTKRWRLISVIERAK